VAGSWSGFGACRDLTVTLGISQRDRGVTYQVIDFTNKGPVTCVLEGYPGVSLTVGPAAVPIGLPAAHNTAQPEKPVTLIRGGVANALLQINTAHTARASCSPVQARYLIVYRPNGASPVTLPYAATACASLVRIMQVSPVALGTGG
jgi:hypothetical protein